MKAEEIQQNLPAFLERQTGKKVRVENVVQMTGGASREIWSLDAVLEGESVPMVLRSAAVGWVRTQAIPEYDLLKAAFDAGVPVPEPLFMSDDVLPVSFFLMRRIPGETIARRLLRDEEYSQAREAMAAQLGVAAARIHAIPADKYDSLGLREPPIDRPPAAAELEGLEETYRTMTPEAHPAFELAFRWLRRRLPEANERCLVHGDFRVGNMIFGPEGLRSVIDWEGAHIGDPMEDLGWVCVRSWRFGGPKPVGGVGDREQLFEAYERESGRPVDADRVRYWEIFGNLRWGVICITQAQRHLQGHSPSVELVSIGRRTVETEVELMELMGGPPGAG
ncbi:MAG TPA: phosphotransferase family protein [Dehalococcoidia bacterium]|nr:phosphotransferase family protein [Dehalococcoidia bacterium]